MARNYQLFLHSDELMLSTVVLSQEVNLLQAGFYPLKLVLLPKKIANSTPTCLKNLDDDSKCNTV